MKLPVSFTVRMRKDGSIMIPAEIVKEFDLDGGISLELTLQQKGER